MGLGIRCKIYRNTGSYGSPTLVAIDKVSDVSVKPSWEKGSADTRESRIKINAKTQLALSITGKIRVDGTDAGYLALLAMFLDGDTPTDLVILDAAQDVNGATGFRADWHLFEWGEEQNLNSVLYRDFSLEPGFPYVNVPKSVLVSGGAPVYTALAS